MKKRLITNYVSMILSVVLVGTILAGCGASDSSYAKEAAEVGAAAYGEPAYEEEYMYDGDVYEYAEEASVSNGADAASDVDAEAIKATANRKLIKTVNMSVETREFDQLIDTINTKVNNLGGYIESSNISGNSYGSTTKRDAYIVARIPSRSLDSFVTCIEEKSNITNKSENAEDVTLQYSDVEAHKASLKIEQERLNALLEQADTLENIIELENRLTEVRYELESYESRLRTLDNQVDYSTVNLNVFEVVEYTPEPVEELTFGQRLSREFIQGCENAWETIQDFIVGFVSILPELLVVLVIIAIIFFIIFFIVKGIIALVKKSKVKHPKKDKTVKNDNKAVTAQILDTKPDAAKEDK